MGGRDSWGVAASLPASRAERAYEVESTLVFFYEILFTVVATIAVIVGELWTRTFTVVFLAAWLAVIWLGYASFQARLRTEELSAEDRLWFENAVDGLRHLRLLFAIGAAVALGWRLLPV